MADANEDQVKTAEVKAKEKTMRLSIEEGCFAGVSINFGDNYIVPYALSLQATPIHIGVLTSLIGVVAPTSQIIGSRLMEKHTRKKLLVSGVFLQALMWPLILLLGILFANNIAVYSLPIFLIVFYLCYVIFGNIAGPSWFSLMGDVVPEDHRGRYFAKRNLICTAIALSITLLFSWFLDNFKAMGLIFTGFSILFVVAFISRSISAKLLAKHYYPPLVFDKSYYVSLWRFIKEIPKENFGHFTLYVALINFGQMIAGPFFSVYMLQDLGFNYSTFITVNLSASIIALMIFPLLGKFSDRFGNVRMLQIGSILIPILPLLWVFLDTPIEIIIGPQLLNGIGWTAFNLAASNFIYDSVPSQRRGLYFSYYNFLIGIGILCGGLTGSLLITVLPITFMNQFTFLFLISGIARFIVVILLLPKIKEVRKVSKFKWTFHFRYFSVHKWPFQHVGDLKQEKKDKETC